MWKAGRLNCVRPVRLLLQPKASDPKHQDPAVELDGTGQHDIAGSADAFHMQLLDGC
jgi:hypothetical protein